LSMVQTKDGRSHDVNPPFGSRTTRFPDQSIARMFDDKKGRS
jgi:hypothetical protein